MLCQKEAQFYLIEGRIDVPITRSERNAPRFAGTGGRPHCNVKKKRNFILLKAGLTSPSQGQRETHHALLAQVGVPIAMSKRSALHPIDGRIDAPITRSERNAPRFAEHRGASPLQCQKEAHFTILMAGLTPPSQGQRETHHALLSTGGRPHCNVKKEHIPP